MHFDFFFFFFSSLPFGYFKVFAPHRILNSSICSAPSSPGAGRTPAIRTVNIPVLPQFLNFEENGDHRHCSLPGKGLCTGWKKEIKKAIKTWEIQNISLCCEQNLLSSTPKFRNITILSFNKQKPPNISLLHTEGKKKIWFKQN